MNREEIVQRFVTLVRHYRGADWQMTPDLPILEQFADSVELMDFVLSLEDEFQLEISDEEVDRFQTVEDVLAYIQEQFGLS